MSFGCTISCFHQNLPCCGKSSWLHVKGFSLYYAVAKKLSNRLCFCNITKYFNIPFPDEKAN